jgi:hypothetical protein
MRKNVLFKKTLTILLLLMLVHSVANATQMNFSGTISDNATWTADTINITGDVTIAATGSLTISGEKSIIFQGQYGISVYGTITSRGTYSSISLGGGRSLTSISGTKGSISGIGGIIVKPPIFNPIIRSPKYVTFKYRSYTTADTNNFSNPVVSTVGWKGITFYSGSKANFYLCKFQFAKSLGSSLFVNYGNATFTSCHFLENKIFNSTTNYTLLFSNPTNASDSLVLNSCYLYKNRSTITVSVEDKFNINYTSIYDNIHYGSGPVSLSVSSGTGTILANRIYNNAAKGLYIFNTNSVLIDRNMIYNQKADALYIYASLATLTNNLIANNTSAGYINGSITAFINNTIVNNSSGLNFVKPAALGGTEVYFYNTILWNNNNADLTGNMNISLNNCILPIALNSATAVAGKGFTVRSFQGNIYQDPNFNSPSAIIGWDANASLAYWAPISSSPCINTGTRTIDPYALPSYDVAGSFRIKQGALDIGAYELYQAVDSIKTAITISSNVLWFADTVKVFGNVTVNTGGKLNIAPGTVVSFQGSYYLKANGGAIIAKGVEYDSIVFTRQNPILPISPSTGVFWSGIDIQSSADSSIFNYCRFEFADRMTSLKGAAINVDFNNNISISNSVFRHNISRSAAGNANGYGSAISAFNSDVNLDKCIFSDNLGLATVFINSSNVKLANSYFTRNNVDIYIAFSTKSVIINSILRANNYILSSTPRFVNCELYQGNGNDTISFSNSSPRFINSVLFTRVSWKDENIPNFVNCIFSTTNYSLLSKYSQKSFVPLVSYIPQFTWDTGTNNYKIENYSRTSFYPSINQGTSALPADIIMPATDILGNIRVNSESIDIGAFEQQGGLPTLTMQPLGNTLCFGSSISFNISNSDTAVYQWQKDGYNLNMGASKNLTLTNLTETNSGAYQCVLRNAYGTVTTHSAQLVVKIPPFLISNTASTWVNNGNPISINTSVGGSSPLYFSWKKDGSTLTSDTTGSLKIPTFGLSNEGSYKCKILNICGIIESQDIKLSVAPELKIISNTTVCENDTFKLAVIFNETATYTWYKDGTVLDKFTGKDLKLGKPTQTDIGNYSCKISNTTGNTVVGPVLMNIRKIPSVDAIPLVTYVDASQEVAISVNASGDEPLTYKWYKNNVAIDGKNDKTFKLSGITKSDEALYKCRVSNICDYKETNETQLNLAPQICLVSNYFAKDSNRNMIIWDRNSSKIYDYYNVYREGFVKNKFVKIGKVLYKDITYFVDTTVNPKSQAFVYKITAVDAKGVETDINATAQHKTIHLLVTQGIPKGIQLDWDEYIGFDYGSYNIFKSVNGGKFAKVYTMASTTHTWTDLNAVNTSNLKYYVSVDRTVACSADKLTQKAGAGPFASAVSNMEDNSRLKFTTTNIVSSETNGLSIYPNPFNNNAELQYQLDIASNVDLSLTDFAGRQINTIVKQNQSPGIYNYKVGEDLKSGVYFVRFKLNETIKVVKIVKY